jgi:hypothetical protein
MIRVEAVWLCTEPMDMRRHRHHAGAGGPGVRLGPAAPCLRVRHLARTDHDGREIVWRDDKLTSASAMATIKLKLLAILHHSVMSVDVVFLHRSG